LHHITDDEQQVEQLASGLTISMQLVETGYKQQQDKGISGKLSDAIYNANT